LFRLNSICTRILITIICCSLTMSWDIGLFLLVNWINWHLYCMCELFPIKSIYFDILAFHNIYVTAIYIRVYCILSLYIQICANANITQTNKKINRESFGNLLETKCNIEYCKTVTLLDISINWIARIQKSPPTLISTIIIYYYTLLNIIILVIENLHLLLKYKVNLIILLHNVICTKQSH